MSINLSLYQLFERAFGFGPSAFEPEFNVVDGFEKSTKTLGKAGSAPMYGTADGREYYLPATISYPSYVPSTVAGVPGSWSGKKVELSLPHPVISVTSRKTIIETPLTERRGTAKELINIMDYQFAIRGLIINGVNEFPEDIITTLVGLYECNAAVGIVSAITDIYLISRDRKGKDDMVIKDFKWSPVTGVKNVWSYEMSCVSDEPFSLYTI